MNINVYNRNFEYKDGLLIGWGSNSIFTPVKFYLELENLSRKLYGDKYAKTLIKDLTNTQSRSVGKFWMKFGFVKKIFFKIGVDNLESAGFGKINLMTSDADNNLILRTKSNFAKEHVKHFGKSKTPVCSYYLSLLNGPLTKLFGFNFVKEKKCIAKGDDECVFES